VGGFVQHQVPSFAIYDIAYCKLPTQDPEQKQITKHMVVQVALPQAEITGVN